MKRENRVASIPAIATASKAFGITAVSRIPRGATASRSDRVTVVAELVMSKTQYGDTVVRLRRQAEMGLAAELQWSLLPPLTFACAEVTVAAALEPAYEVAGDTVRGEYDAAHQVMDELGKLGIEYDDVIETLESEGVDKFVKSWDELVGTVEQGPFLRTLP